MELNKAYWDNRYRNQDTPWALYRVAPWLVHFIAQHQPHKDSRILIPGAGTSMEARYLWELGYHNLYVADISPAAMQKMGELFPELPEDHKILDDFFRLKGSFDLILEQTFFCALDPEMRQAYTDKMYELLSHMGQLAGVFFNFPLTTSGPPFGGSESEYRSRFSTKFKISVLEPCLNSAPERAGKELFFIFEKKSYEPGTQPDSQSRANNP